jgi:uncharacterized protein (TIGR00369 family)
MKNHLEQVIEIFEKQIPANKLLGLKVISISAQKTEVFVPFKPEFIGDYRQGFWHGGILASIADAAGGLAGFITLSSPEDKINTIDMRIDYLTPAILEDINVSVKLIKVGKRILNADVVLYQSNIYKPVAVARCAYSILRT